MAGLPPHPEQLRVFPSRLAVDRWLRLEPGECSTLSGVTTFGALLESLGSLGSSRYAPPLLCRVLLRTLLASSTGWMRDAARDPFAVRAVHRAVVELRQAGVTSGHLVGRSISPGLAALAGLLARYEGALGDASLADDADWQRSGVLATAEGRVPASLARVRRVTVEGGASLFGARIDLLAALAARGVAVEVRLPWDDERAELFAWPEASLTNLESRTSLDVAVTFDDRVGSGPLAALRAAQFTDAVVPDAPARLLQAPSRAEHGRLIAAQVSAWLRDGVAADDVCVAVANLDDLGPVVTVALDAVGVPAYMRRGERLRHTAPGRSLVAALRLAEQEFPREPLLELWRALGRQVETPAGARGPAEVAAAVRAAGVRSQRLPGFRAGLVARATQRARRSGADDALVEANAVADALGGVIDSVAALPEVAPLGDQVAALEELIGALGLSGPELVAGDDCDLLRAQARRHAAIDALADVLVELRQVARTSRWPGDWHRGELADLLTLVCEERRLAPRGMRTGSVAVLGIEDLVEASYQRVILAGVDADTFPRAPAPDLVLTEDLRSEINRLAGPRLLQAAPMTGRGALHGTTRDLWQWLEALRSAEHELVVTFATPGHAAEGRSELVDELHRSLGEPEVGPSPPACVVHVGSQSQALERWSLASLAGSARIADAATPGQSAALDAAVRAAAASRVAAIEARVESERHIQKEGRALPIIGEQRLLIERRFLDEIHSSSRLDLLGACRFRHFAAVILGLEREQVPTLGPDPREEGSAAHAALWLVYRDLVARGGMVAAREQPAATVARARDVFEASVDPILAEVTVHPLLRRATLEDAWAAVATQLERDLERKDAHEPVALEHSFNERPETPAPPLDIEHPDGGRVLRVRGSIDRVDTAGEALVTLDYKRTHRRRGAGRHFQLPIYGLAAKRDLHTGASEMSAAWITLRDGKRHLADGLHPDPVAFAAQLERDLWARVDPVLAGDVTPDPDSADMCRACDFSALCRYDAAGDAGEGEG